MASRNDNSSSIALNFLPIVTEDFRVQIYVIPYTGQEKPVTEHENAVMRYLDLGDGPKRYWTFFNGVSGATRVNLKPFDNPYATVDALRLALEESCNTNLREGDYQIHNSIRRNIEVVIEKHEEGIEVLALEPYLLRSKGQFGILAEHRFHPFKEYGVSKRTLQLSLSLDQNGQPNPDFYTDKNAKIMTFVRTYHERLFPLHLQGTHEIQVGNQLLTLRSISLDAKRYIVKDNQQSKSQFIGVKSIGPFRKNNLDTQLFFLYRRNEHGLSQDLFKALRGDTFQTFPGMQRMFDFPISQSNVQGAVINGFSPKDIDRVAELVKANSVEQNVVPIVITPFGRHDRPEENDAYWKLKHAFLEQDMPIQVVAADTIRNREKFKWSTSGIGLQIFAKSGGTPWRVVPETDNCLIVGIGQAHKVDPDSGIERYFAYSVLTDSTGEFKEIRILSTANDEDNYIESFHLNLENIFDEYASDFSNFAVHSMFSIRRNELDGIADALKAQEDKVDDGQFVSMKFNSRNRFFGFHTGHNTRIPYESSVVTLSHNEYLVWFEGLQYGQSVVHNMIGGPLHVRFTYPRMLDIVKKRTFLQDAINLSGANWRGFNAKSLPVSVYYAQIIATYLKQFETRGLPTIQINNLTPWFL